MADRNIFTDIGNTGDNYNSLLGSYFTKLSIGKYSRSDPFEPAKWERRKAIILPLPNVLKDDTNVGYDNVNMGAIGDIINSDWKGLTARLGTQAATGLVGTAIPNFIDGAVRGPGQSGQLGDAIDNNLIASAVQQVSGTAPNPNATVAFTGPELRSFTFTWSLQPRKAEESRKIKDVITLLKQSALPSNDLSGSVAILNYPALVQLNFYPWDFSGSSNDWGWGDESIIKIKRCFMSSVNVNYSPSNIPAFFEGDSRPVAIELSIEFKEIEYMLANDWGVDKGKEGLLDYAGRIKDAFLTPFRGSAKEDQINQAATDITAGFGTEEDPSKATP